MKKGKNKKKFTLDPKTIAVPAGALVAAGILFVAVSDFIERSSYFKIRAIMINPSLEFIDKGDLTYLKGKNIFSVDLKSIQKKLQFKYPQVDELQVEKLFPNQILVTAKARHRFVQIPLKNRWVTLDDSGVVLHLNDKRDDALPLMKGLGARTDKFTVGMFLDDRNTQTGLKIIEQFQTEHNLLSYKIQSVDVENLSKITFGLQNDLKVIIDKDKVNQGIKILGFILSKKELNLSEVNYIDLRFKEAIIGKK